MTFYEIALDLLKFMNVKGR